MVPIGCRKKVSRVPCNVYYFGVVVSVTVNTCIWNIDVRLDNNNIIKLFGIEFGEIVIISNISQIILSHIYNILDEHE